jgi:hypothetical protein
MAPRPARLTPGGGLAVAALVEGALAGVCVPNLVGDFGTPPPVATP